MAFLRKCFLHNQIQKTFSSTRHASHIFTRLHCFNPVLCNSITHIDPCRLDDDLDQNSRDITQKVELDNGAYLGKENRSSATYRGGIVQRNQDVQINSDFILTTSTSFRSPRRVGDSSILSSSYAMHVPCLSRCFHIGFAVQAKRKFDEVGVKSIKKPKREKREKRTQPPVEAPYVPPRPKRAVWSSRDKIIDIFDGMTLVELAKRTGEGIDTLQDILLNIGEQVSLEFQPITMDVAELVAMD